MAPIGPSHQEPYEMVTDSESPVARGNLHHNLDPLYEISEENSRRRSRAEEMRRSPPGREHHRAHSNRVSKSRRRKRRRRLSSSSSTIISRRSAFARRIRCSPQPTHSQTIDGQNPRSSRVGMIWYRIPPPENVSPGLVIARFYDELMEVNQTSVLDISRPFTDLLEVLKRQSDLVKAYFTGTMGGFTMDDGPWWYEILIRQDEGETLSSEEQWVLLGDVQDYELLINRVMLNPRTWSVVFRHHTQMLHYGLSERTRAIMRQRVSGKPQEDREIVEDMIARASPHQADETSDEKADDIAVNIDPMDIS